MKICAAILGLGLIAAQTARADAEGDCGTIVMPTGAGQAGADDLTSFNPLFVDTAYNQEAGWLLYPNLLWINRYAKIDWQRSLATSVSVSPDDTVFTITMRKWRWSDGVPVTAADVAYGFKLDKALGTEWPSYGGGGLPYIVKSMTVLDPMHLRIVTTHPVNPMWFIYNAISGLEPLPEHAWKNYTLDQMFQLQSTPGFFNVTDGPLRLAKLVMGMDAVFVPSPAWQGPKMHFTRLIFRFQQGDGVNVQGVEAGDLDEAELPTDLYDSIRHPKGMHVEVLEQSDAENVYYLNFRNPKVAFFRDVRVRDAMIDAIDQNAIVAGLEHGNGDPAYGPVPRTWTEYLTPAMQKGIYPVGFDPAKARALLREAGYTPGRDGIMQKHGKPLAFTYLEESGTDAVTELDEIEQADWRAVGIDMKIYQVEFNQLIALLTGPPDGWEAAGVGLSASDYPSGEGQFATGAFQNSGGYSNPKMDALIDANINSPGLDKLYAYETYASAQQPVIFTPRERSVLLVNNRLHGLRNFINPFGMYAPDQLYCTAREKT